MNGSSTINRFIYHLRVSPPLRKVLKLPYWYCLFICFWRAFQGSNWSNIIGSKETWWILVKTWRKQDENLVKTGWKLDEHLVSSPTFSRQQGCVFLVKSEGEFQHGFCQHGENMVRTWWNPKVWKPDEMRWSFSDFSKNRGIFWKFANTW